MCEVCFQEFTCDDLNESQFVQMPELCPVEQEDNEISWRVGLRRRDTYPHWKSASGCHFNCISPGSGIRLVVAKSKNSRSSIQLCQADQFVRTFILLIFLFGLLFFLSFFRLAEE